MKCILAVPLVVLAALAIHPAAIAQNLALQADIPFSFNVGGKLLPAGTYSVSKLSARILLIRSSSTAALTSFNNFNRTDQTGLNAGTDDKLVFAHQGSDYMLKEVQSSGAFIQADIPTARRKERASAKLASAKLASLDPEITVTVALN